MPYLHYDEVEFDVIVGSYGDAFDRYAIRLNEIRESMRIVRQILDRMPDGDYRIQDKKVTPPPRARIDESMEALIHHFKIFTEGFKVPEGEVYVAIESPRGEIGCYIASDGSSTPYRMHVRGPSFVNIQCLPHMMPRWAGRRRGGRDLERRPGARRGRSMSIRSATRLAAVIAAALALAACGGGDDERRTAPSRWSRPPRSTGRCRPRPPTAVGTAPATTDCAGDHRPRRRHHRAGRGARHHGARRYDRTGSPTWQDPPAPSPSPSPPSRPCSSCRRRCPTARRCR